jgi:Putative Actinobacterial Holin-X, holin superfamily III
MEQTFSKAEELVEHLKEYANNRADQIKLSTSEKTAKLFSWLIAIGVIVALVVFFILFAAVALSLYMGEVFGAAYWGFLFTGAVLLLMALLLWMFRAQLLQYPIMTAMIQQLFTKDEEAEDEED